MIYTAPLRHGPRYGQRPLFRLGETNAQEISGGVSAAGSVAAGLAPIIGITAAVPFIGPAVAAITAIVSALGIGNGCGATCVKATEVVNYWEPFLQKNLLTAQQVVSQQGCLTPDERTALLGNFDQIWGYVYQQCEQIPAPGGTQCISDRQQGSTKIAGGSWFTLYRDPIAAMPVCAPAAAAAAAVTGNVTTVTNTATSPAVSAAVYTTTPAVPPSLLYAGLGLLALGVLFK